MLLTGALAFHLNLDFVCSHSVPLLLLLNFFSSFVYFLFYSIPQPVHKIHTNHCKKKICTYLIIQIYGAKKSTQCINHPTLTQIKHNFTCFLLTILDLFYLKFYSLLFYIWNCMFICCIIFLFAMIWRKVVFFGTIILYLQIFVFEWFKQKAFTEWSDKQIISFVFKMGTSRSQIAYCVSEFVWLGVKTLGYSKFGNIITVMECLRDWKIGNSLGI